MPVFMVGDKVKFNNRALMDTGRSCAKFEGMITGLRSSSGVTIAQVNWNTAEELPFMVDITKLRKI